MKKSTKTFFYLILDNCIYEYLVQLCNKSTRKPWKKNNTHVHYQKLFLIFDNCIYEYLVHQLENHEQKKYGHNYIWSLTTASMII